MNTGVDKNKIKNYLGNFVRIISQITRTRAHTHTHTHTLHCAYNVHVLGNVHVLETIDSDRTETGDSPRVDELPAALLHTKKSSLKEV